MAIKYYGSCTGTSSGKYDLWMTVAQNSQNISSNTSNLTVKVFLKRNDGYPSSAYNLTESENNIKISVGGVSKVNKNITVDTRNNVTVTLAQWKGDVTHNADGSLSVAINAVFTMGNTTLSGGSVKGSFKCTTIPRASSMSFSSTSVNPGSDVDVSISSASKSFTHRIIWGIGNKNSSAELAASVTSYVLSVPVSWASQLTDASKGVLNVSLKTYNNGVLIGTVKYSIGFVIPKTDDYLPDFDIAFERIDNNVPVDWGEYLKGISQLGVIVSNGSYKYGATFDSVAITVCGVTKRAFPAVFDLTASGDITVSVTVRDSRGLSRKKSRIINVCDYSPPSVNMKSITRCDADGSVNPRGTYLCMNYDVSYSDVNSKNTYNLVLKYRNTKAQYYSDDTCVVGSPFVFGDGNIGEGSSYIVSVGISDEVLKSGEILCSVPVADIPFNIRKGGKGAAFGKFAENDNELSVAWDLYVQGNLTVDGTLNYVNLNFQETEYSENAACEIRYYPTLREVLLRIRFKVLTDIPKGDVYTVIKIPDKPPAIFTPLQSVVGHFTDCSSSVGVFNTGDVAIRTETDIAAGTYVYISGSYIV
ncbi:MAG: hypothetical protein IJ025_04425 [Clostridia bacterium]|nr:hypothetical protein [Clostridia bacterium]